MVKKDYMLRVRLSEEEHKLLKEFVELDPRTSSMSEFVRDSIQGSRRMRSRYNSKEWGEWRWVIDRARYLGLIEIAEGRIKPHPTFGNLEQKLARKYLQHIYSKPGIEDWRIWPLIEDKARHLGMVLIADEGEPLAQDYLADKYMDWQAWHESLLKPEVEDET